MGATAERSEFPRRWLSTRLLATLGSALANRLSPALVGLALARVWGPTGLGVYATTGALSAGLAAILDFGSPLQVQAAAGSDSSAQSLGRAIGQAYLARGIAILGGAVVATLVASVLVGDIVSASTIALLAAAVAVGESGWLLTTVGRCNALERSGLVAAALGAPLPAIAVLVSSRISKNDTFLAATVLLAQAAIIVAWSTAVTRRATLRAWTPRKQLQYAKAGLPYALATSLMWVYGQSDVLVTTGLLGPGAGGTYYGNYRLFAVCTMVAIAAAAHWGPQFFGLLNQKPIDHKGVKFVDARISQLAFWGLLGGCLLALLGPIGTRLLFGPKFPAIPAIHYVLAAALPPYFLGVILGGALTGHGRQDLRTGLQGAAAATNLVLNVLLLRSGGVVVPAATTTLTAGLLLILYLRECVKLGLTSRRVNLIATTVAIVAVIVSVIALSNSLTQAGNDPERFDIVAF